MSVGNEYIYMKNGQNRRPSATLLLASILVAFCSTVPAQQPPSGLFQYAFSAEQGLPLWNFTGPYSLPSYFDGFEFDDASHLRHSANGRITATYDQADPGLAALAGTITSSSKIKLRLSSTTTVSKYYSGAKIKDRYSLTFDPTNRIFTGTDRVTQTSQQLVMDCPGSFWECNNYRMANVTSASVQPVTIPTPETADGNWTLTLEIAPDKNKLSGTGSIVFSNGESFQFQLLGRYSAKTQKSKILLRGTGADKGATLWLSIVGPDMGIESLRGIVGGQRIHLP